MSELEVVSNTSFPRTRQSIADDLRQLGLNPGAIALVHSSLSSLGWVCGGAVAVVQALMDVVTEAGTLVMPTHSGDYCLGEKFPLARLYDLNASVLLLEVGYDCSTCFHLAEYRAGKAKKVQRGSPILEAEKRVWKNYEDLDFSWDCFDRLGQEFERQDSVKVANVVSASTRLFLIKPAVDFAINWFEKA